MSLPIDPAFPFVLSLCEEHKRCAQRNTVVCLSEAELGLTLVTEKQATTESPMLIPEEVCYIHMTTSKFLNTVPKFFKMHKPIFWYGIYKFRY